MVTAPEAVMSAPVTEAILVPAISAFNTFTSALYSDALIFTFKPVVALPRTATAPWASPLLNWLSTVTVPATTLTRFSCAFCKAVTFAVRRLTTAFFREILVCLPTFERAVAVPSTRTETVVA